MLDLVFKNYTSPRSRMSSGLRQKNSRTSLRGRQNSPGVIFFKKVLNRSAKELKLESKLELSINLVGEAKIKELNRKYRKQDKPTDVLSFPLGDGGGDIFICLSIAKSEAKRENISIEKKLAQLTVHGFLHLAGHDHERSSKDAEKMLKLENQILNKLEG